MRNGFVYKVNDLAWWMIIDVADNYEAYRYVGRGDDGEISMSLLRRISLMEYARLPRKKLQAIRSRLGK